MKNLRRNFFNGIQEGDRKIMWVKWHTVLAAKKFRGLGLISAIHGSSITDLSTAYPSTWNSIIKEFNYLKVQGVDVLSHCKIRIGNGLHTQFWKDFGSDEGIEEQQLEHLRCDEIIMSLVDFGNANFFIKCDGKSGGTIAVWDTSMFCVLWSWIILLIGSHGCGSLPPETSKVAAVDDALCERDALLRQLRDNLLAAKNRMEVKANRKRRELEFSIGDKVLVKLQPVTFHIFSKIHPLFHVYLLKLFSGSDTFKVTPIPEGSTEGHPVEEPVAICGTREVLRGGRMEQQVLVQWAGRSLEEATWEWLSEFQNVYPAYDLEDKVIFEGTGNDTPAVREPRRTPRASVAPGNDIRISLDIHQVIKCESKISWSIHIKCVVSIKSSTANQVSAVDEPRDFRFAVDDLMDIETYSNIVPLNFRIGETNYATFMTDFLNVAESKRRCGLIRLYIHKENKGKSEKGELSIFPKTFTVLTPCLQMLPKVKRAVAGDNA
ncbi:ty3-gypsy retrotransposon protein [Tanacetum coccineum]|uniref:Ty3-gypsy retrotransposon protein n=1 Tax=Tanacetum coccineum TaxID=301880 RepID=A0ABQ5H2Z2_9ASTR